MSDQWVAVGDDDEIGPVPVSAESGDEFSDEFGDEFGMSLVMS